MKTHELFPTTIATFDLSQHPLLDITIRHINNLPTDCHSLLTNNGQSNYGYDSNFLYNPVLKGLKETLDDCVDQYCSVNGHLSIQMSNSWFNILKEEQRVEPHRHEKSVVSGALYVEVESESCDLHFVNPTSLYKMNELYSHPTPYNTKFEKINCTKGKLILFPSWLEHYTNTNKSTKRTVISFNYG